MILGTGCAGIGKIPDVQICLEIPFKDGPEGACTTTVSHSPTIIKNQDWTKLRPTMLMIKASEWSKIRKYWLKACRYAQADGESCNIAVDSIDKAVKDLDKAIDLVMP